MARIEMNNLNETMRDHYSIYIVAGNYKDIENKNYQWHLTTRRQIVGKIQFFVEDQSLEVPEEAKIQTVKYDANWKSPRRSHYLKWEGLEEAESDENN